MRHLIVLATVIATPAMAQPAVPSAAWYASHDGVRNRILDICRDNPGEAERNDHCKAAFAGSGIAAEREAKRNYGDNTPPTSLDYWKRRPGELRTHLATCDRITPEEGARIWCREAREAARQMQDETEPQQPRRPQTRARKT